MANATTAATTAATSNVHPRDVLNGYLWWVLGFVVIITIAFGIKHEYGDGARQKKPEKTNAQELVVQANGFSKHVIVPVGLKVKYSGHGYIIHCVYADAQGNGSEDSYFGDEKRSCRDGRMLYQYLQDTTGDENVVPYAFVRP